jgi:DNA modification methylase
MPCYAVPSKVLVIYEISVITDQTLILGDCLDVMKIIDTQSIDMILCDLPYGTIHWNRLHEWDNVIPLQPMWEQYWRIIKPKGAILLFGNEPFSTQLKYSQLQYYKYDYIWKKSIAGGFANAKVKPLKLFELISVFSQGTTSPGRHNNM